MGGGTLCRRVARGAAIKASRRRALLSALKRLPRSAAAPLLVAVGGPKKTALASVPPPPGHPAVNDDPWWSLPRNGARGGRVAVAAARDGGAPSPQIRFGSPTLCGRLSTRSNSPFQLNKYELLRKTLLKSWPSSMTLAKYNS